MLDPDLIESNPTAQLGLKMLAASGVLAEQMVRLQQRLLSGDPDEKTDDLIKKVLEFRNQNRNIAALIELAEQYVQEETNDEPR